MEFSLSGENYFVVVIQCEDLFSRNILGFISPVTGVSRSGEHGQLDKYFTRKQERIVPEYTKKSARGTSFSRARGGS